MDVLTPCVFIGSRKLSHAIDWLPLKTFVLAKKLSSVLSRMLNNTLRTTERPGGAGRPELNGR
jgi:hypothetical protein